MAAFPLYAAHDRGLYAHGHGHGVKGLDNAGECRPELRLLAFLGEALGLHRVIKSF